MLGVEKKILALPRPHQNKKKGNKMKYIKKVGKIIVVLGLILGVFGLMGNNDLDEYIEVNACIESGFCH